MNLGDYGHLAYCTNIHPGESWHEVKSELERYLPQIKERLGRGDPMGVGLRLSQAAAATLASDREQRLRFKSFLDDNGFYVFTINGFPYGRFHRTRVKDSVYLPDWRDPSRLAYSNLLADLLADWLPEGSIGSISTVPCAYRAHLSRAQDLSQIARMLIEHAAHLHRLRQETGKIVVLALEPEPGCLLESTADVVRFFGRHLHDHDAIRLFSSLTGLAAAAAEDALRLHLGVCLDICHVAVGFEDPVESISTLRREGIDLHKIQLSAGIRVRHPGPMARKSLEPFADDVYLHQLAARTGQHIGWWQDLADALGDERSWLADEWRVHFHVPLWTETNELFSTTAQAVIDVLAAHRRQPFAPHLEVETYTWDLLAEGKQKFDLATSISKELQWVLAQLDS